MWSTQRPPLVHLSALLIRSINDESADDAFLGFMASALVVQLASSFTCVRDPSADHKMAKDLAKDLAGRAELHCGAEDVVMV